LAVAWSRGFANDETKAAFARARELSVGTENLDERFTSLYGQWITSLSRAELGLARQTAETFLREAERAARMPETVAALRYLGLTCLVQGHFVDARTHLEEVRRIYDPSRDRDASFRFGTDSLASATIYLAQVSWQFGEFKRARELSDEAVARAVESAHDPTLANIWLFRTAFEMARDDAEGTLRAARALCELSERLKLPIYSSGASVYSCWARLRLGDSETSFAELRQYLANHKMLGTKIGLPFIQAKIAEIEGNMEDAKLALVHIDEALAFANDTGEHQYRASLHSIRGKILLKLDPAKTEVPEDSLLTAIAIAQQQGNGTCLLQAALILAKLYQATNRAADARAVLAPALEGFSPTPEFPEIKEAQKLHSALTS
jgi:tetratricopeptide (TPR) repeat protein